MVRTLLFKRLSEMDIGFDVTIPRLLLGWIGCLGSDAMDKTDRRPASKPMRGDLGRHLLRGRRHEHLRFERSGGNSDDHSVDVAVVEIDQGTELGARLRRVRLDDRLGDQLWVGLFSQAQLGAMALGGVPSFA